ncbi:MAG: acetate--CoA ligase family protein [Deltaproteobacteria bacterium]|nr:acetate--CoA ligase family protein [Deltaproteobacteria bacterium]
MSNKVLDRFFHPKSIAVIGASESIYSYGTRYIQALLDFGYRGKIFAVNHKGEKTLGYKIYRSLDEIKDTIDLAFITIPARFIADILKECIAKDIKTAVAFTAGFSETGAEGRGLEKELLKTIDGRLRLMGPNCFGPYCPGGGITVVTGADFSKEPGEVALIAQTGQLSECIIARAQGEGIRYSKSASYGNAVDINEADLIDYLMDDKDTRIITQYLEGVRDGRRFFDIARRNFGKKPHLIWKVGLTQMGASASSSHTGSLAGTGAAWDAFFQQTGAIKVSTLDELTDTTVAFHHLPKGCGLRVGYISGGGAGTVLGADACENAGMRMPAFTEQTEKRLAELLPGVGLSFRNPVDVGHPHPPKELMQSLFETMSADRNIDLIVVRRILFSVKMSKIFSGSTAPSEKEQQELLEVPVKVMRKYNKPIIIILPDDMTGAESIYLEEERRKIRDFFFAKGIPVFMSEQRAFTALSHLSKFKLKNSACKAADKKIPAPLSGSKTRRIFQDLLKKSTASIPDEIQCKKVLKSAGIKVTLPVRAVSKNQAIAVADKMGYPVVMKIVSPQITHKSDFGGVRLKLENKKQVGTAYNEIMAAVRKMAPKARINGVSIQKMAAPGLELVMGMTRDPQFGPILMFGLGGTSVEILGDVAFRMTPLTRKDAKEMIQQIKGYPLLEGYRGQPPVDIPYIEDMLMKISAFAEENPEIKEMDINPILAYKKGAVAVDARIILDEKMT